jgi:hypothetical protein
MLLSAELSALQNQIAKRISATNSITAKSEYGLDILVGSILLLCKMILAKRFHLKKGCCKVTYYVSGRDFLSFVRSKIFLK